MSDQSPPDDSANHSLVYVIGPSETFCEAIVNAVSAASGMEPVPAAAGTGNDDVLDPLYSRVDPDALESLLRSAGTDGRGDCRVVFELNGYRATVHSYGVVQVGPCGSSTVRA